MTKKEFIKLINNAKVDENGESGRYDRHFTQNDDTLEILIVKEKQKKQK